MSKLIMSPIQVLCDPGGHPLKIKPVKEWVEITEIFECWHDTGCWWRGESEKVFYRLFGSDLAIREIYQDCQSEQWFLYKVYD